MNLPAIHRLLLLLVILLAGCVQPPERPLKVAAHQWLAYEPLFLARYINAYERPVDVIQLPSSIDSLRALRNGSVDVAAATLDQALLLKSQGEDLVVLLALDFSTTADRAESHGLLNDPSAPEPTPSLLVCQHSLFEQRSADLQELVRGYYRARKYMMDYPEEANAFIGHRLRLDQAELARALEIAHLPSLEENRQWMKGQPSTFDHQRSQLETFMQERNLLDYNPEGRLQGNNQWLQQVMP